MIDWTRVTELRAEIGAEDFEEVVEIFLEEVDAELAALPAVRPPESLSEKLHFLKGSALNLGFSDFAALCEDGEQSLRHHPEKTLDLGALGTRYEKSRAYFLEELPDRIAD